jgi:DNA-binding CsgD family transcriptional regulator
MLTTGRESESRGAELWGHLWRIDAAFERGDLARASREIEAAAWCTREVRGRLAQWQLLRCQATLAQAQARFDDARRIAADAFATLAPTENPAAFLARAALFSTIGHHIGHDAESLVANGLAYARKGALDFPTRGVIQALAPAHILAEIGRLREASSIYRSLGPVAEWRPTPHVTLFSYAYGIALAVALDAFDDAATLRDLLSPYRGHHVVSGACSVAYFGPVELWLGIAAAHLDLLDDAIVDLEHALKASAASGAAGFNAETQYELAAALARRGRPGDLPQARALVADSAKEASALGMVPIAAKATQLMDQLTAVQVAPLTPRESEVARLVAQGLTNREIAARLYVSDRTAENHVQHILTKLDLSNRSQIAVWITSQKRNEYPTE